MRFDEFPRFMGNPVQVPVTSSEEMENYVKANNGVRPVYTSHNAYVAMRDVVNMRYIPADLDSDPAKGGKPENTLADAIHFVEWAEANDLVPYVNFSAGKGFHGYVEFKPIPTKNTLGLKAVYRAFQKKMIREARLRFFDPAIIGDTNRILRLPNTQYVSMDKKTKELKPNGLWCVEVPRDLLFDGDYGAIVEYAREPRPGIVKTPRETLREAVERLHVKPDYERGPTMEGPPSVAPFKECTDDFVKMVLQRPCLSNGIMTSNPPHRIRFETAATLARARWDIGWALRFLHEIAEKAKWVDRGNASVTGYQTLHIYRNIDRYSPTSCQLLRAEGLCVGESCPLYKKVFE